MKKRSILLVLSVILSMLFLANCSSSTPQPTALPATPTITATPDPCAPGNLETEVQKIHKYMRQFDDESALAASLPKNQLQDAIKSLQSIRRDAEDQSTPVCLEQLRSYQISHMNSVINTLIAFLGGADQQVVNEGLASARQQHDQYTIELARVLGLTVVPLPTSTETSTSPDSTPTP
jgi:hypothetical protein